MDKKIESIKEYVKSILSSEATGHDYFHSLRVMNNAIQISKGIDLNIDLVKIASLTHDLIDKKVTSNIDLSKTRLIEKLLALDYDKTFVSQVIQIIESISYSKGLIPFSIEGKIVQDADRLEALGAIGIARTFAYGGNHNRLIYNPLSLDREDSVSHFYDKLFKLTDLMNTETARLIAIKRTELMKNYLESFYKEWEGKDL